MPMPTGGEWPPKHIAPAYAAYRDWDAWYTGLPDQLARVYQGRDTNGNQSLPPSQRTRPSQLAGGVIGAISRWLWGAPTPQTSMDNRLHVPLASDLASTAAALMFSEAPTFTSPSSQDRLDQMVEDGLVSAMRHAAEANSAMGDIYLRPVIDREVSPDAAIITCVHADGAIPTLRWGRLVEVTLWAELDRDGQRVWRLLEHHDVVNNAGRITYALYRGTPTHLGDKMRLEEHPDAEYLAGLVDSEGRQATGLDRLDVVRIPNAGPQRRWRKHGGGLKYLGRSDFDGNEQVFDRIDAAWTSWMRDIHLGRGRITVPSWMLENLGPGQGAYFHADREVYSAITSAPAADGKGAAGLTVSQFQIRHVEHKATIDALVETAMRHAGLSSQTLGEEGDVAMTATEAQARERLSYVTRGDRIATWTAGLRQYLELHTLVEQKAGLGRSEPVTDVTIDWPDAVSESPETTAKTVQLLRAADAISVETSVRWVHPDWDDPQVAAEVRRIREDQAMGGPDPAEQGNTFARADMPPDPDEEPAAGE